MLIVVTLPLGLLATLLDDEHLLIGRRVAVLLHYTTWPASRCIQGRRYTVEAGLLLVGRQSEPCRHGVQAVIRQSVHSHAKMHAALPLAARHAQQCSLVAPDVLGHGIQAVIRQSVDLQTTMHAATPLTARHPQKSLLVALDVLRHGVQVAAGLLFMVSMPLLPHVPVVLHCQHCSKPRNRSHST